MFRIVKKSLAGLLEQRSAALSHLSVYIYHRLISDMSPGVESPAKRHKMEVDDVDHIDSDASKTMTSMSQPPPPVLKFAKLSPTASAPIQGSEHAAGFDLVSNADVVVPAKKPQKIPTGIQIALPEGCYGRIAPRSSLAKKFIDVGAGVIDRDYRGEVMVMLYNFSEEDFVVERGDRIAQLICERIFMPTVVECTKLDETVRGAGGFGSTGTKEITTSNAS